MTVKNSLSSSILSFGGQEEEMQHQFAQLAAIVPGLKKTDNISLLESTIDYLKLLEEKIKFLEETDTPRTAELAGFDGDDEFSSPAVEASIRGNMVLLKICCKERRGVMVMVLSELENQGLSIVNTNVLPFTDSCLNIIITAKTEERSSSVVELVTNLTMALRGFT